MGAASVRPEAASAGGTDASPPAAGSAKESPIGDGIGLATEPVASITARESTEILLIDLGPAAGARPGAS